MQIVVSVVFLAFIAEFVFSMPQETVNVLPNRNYAKGFIHKTLNFNKRKLNGREVTPVPKHTYPHQVLLEIMDNNSIGTWGYFCAGSILNNNSVLTSAYCARNCVENLCQMVAGVHNVLDTGEEDRQIRSVSKISIHPRLNRSDYDYGIIFPDAPWKFNEAVKPIDISQYPPKGNCVASGWMSKDELSHVNLTIVPNEECQKIYGDVLQITKRMICTVCDLCDDQKDCFLDFGGPMLCAGVLSGIGSRIHPYGEPKFPSIYCNVEVEKEWIQNPSENRDSMQ